MLFNQAKQNLSQPLLLIPTWESLQQSTTWYFISLICLLLSCETKAYTCVWVCVPSTFASLLPYLSGPCNVLCLEQLPSILVLIKNVHSQEREEKQLSDQVYIFNFRYLQIIFSKHTMGGKEVHAACIIVWVNDLIIGTAVTHNFLSFFFFWPPFQTYKLIICVHVFKPWHIY